MAVRKRVSLLVFVSLLAAASFCTSASDRSRPDGLKGRKFLFESAETNKPRLTDTYFSETLAAHQEPEYKISADSGRNLLQWPRPPSPETLKNGDGEEGHEISADSGRNLLQWPRPPSPETLESVEFHDLDTGESDFNFHIDYPEPKPHPTPDGHDYPPPASWGSWDP